MTGDGVIEMDTPAVAAGAAYDLHRRFAKLSGLRFTGELEGRDGTNRFLVEVARGFRADVAMLGRLCTEPCPNAQDGGMIVEAVWRYVGGTTQAQLLGAELERCKWAISFGSYHLPMGTKVFDADEMEKLGRLGIGARVALTAQFATEHGNVVALFVWLEEPEHFSVVIAEGTLAIRTSIDVYLRELVEHGLVKEPALYGKIVDVGPHATACWLDTGAGGEVRVSVPNAMLGHVKRQKGVEFVFERRSHGIAAFDKSDYFRARRDPEQEADMRRRWRDLARGASGGPGGEDNA